MRPPDCLRGLALLLVLLNSTADATAGARPNILFVLTDDQAPWAMGNAVHQGRFADVPAAHTPTLDRLAREGLQFFHFYCTTPVCSPARVALLTGRYASEFGVTDFIPSVDHRLFDPERQMALAPEAAETFPQILQRHGYVTGLVGKLHVGDWTLPGHEHLHPTRNGFDYFMGLTSGGTRPQDPVLEKEGVVSQFQGLTTDILTDHAIEFLERASQQTQPFLLCLHTRAPHGAWLPVAPSDWEPYSELDPTIPDYPGLDTDSVKRNMREYLASVSGVDRNLGRLLDRLQTLELDSNTVVIFTSDHGYNMGHNGIWHKGNGIWATRRKPPGKLHHGTKVISAKYRPNMYDLSLNVPAIVRWPGVIQPGSKMEATASHLDWFPTLLEIAQITPSPELQLRGRSLMGLMRGSVPKDWDQNLLAEYHMIQYVEADLWCLRTPRYKLVRDLHQEGRDEFFDLSLDPHESVNLIDDETPKIQAALREVDRQLSERKARILAASQPAQDPP